MTTEMESTMNREPAVVAERNEEGSRPEVENEAQNQPEESANTTEAANDDANNPACAKPAKKKRAASQGDSNKKRKKAKKWGKNSVVDKNKLTMFDLISYNPPAIDALSQLNEDEAKLDDEDGEPGEEEKEQSKEQPAPERPSEDSKANEEEENDDEESIGPRVKINENGEIVLDEESLVVKRKKPKDQSIKTVYEDDKIISTRTNYSSFKKPGNWTEEEIEQFAVHNFRKILNVMLNKTIEDHHRS